MENCMFTKLAKLAFLPTLTLERATRYYEEYGCIEYAIMYLLSVADDLYLSGQLSNEEYLTVLSTLRCYTSIPLDILHTQLYDQYSIPN